MSEAEKLLSELSSAVAEQQFTVNSLGWNQAESGKVCDSWSTAGARRHQFDKIEEVLTKTMQYFESLPS